MDANPAQFHETRETKAFATHCDQLPGAPNAKIDTKRRCARAEWPRLGHFGERQHVGPIIRTEHETFRLRSGGKRRELPRHHLHDRPRTD